MNSLKTKPTNVTKMVLTDLLLADFSLDCEEIIFVVFRAFTDEQALFFLYP